jgi:hypothetical protein
MAALARTAHGVRWRPLASFAAKAVTASVAVAGLLWVGRGWAAVCEGGWGTLLLLGAAASGAAVYACVLVCLRTEEALELGRMGRGLLRREH